MNEPRSAPGSSGRTRLSLAGRPERTCGLFLTGVAPGDAQQAADWYALGRAALEGYKRQPVDYGSSEQTAIEKVRRDCAQSGDQISEALDQGVKAEQRNCRMNRACKNRALNVRLFQLDVDEMMEQAFHGLRDGVIDSQDDPRRQAALRQDEAIRHERRLADINESRATARDHIEPSRDKLWRVLDNDLKKDLAWALSGKKRPPPGQ